MIEWDAISITVSFGGFGMVWIERLELVSCRVKRLSSVTQFFFFFRMRRNRTVNGDMPRTASLWLWDLPMNFISTAVESPNFVPTLSKAEDQGKTA